MTHLAPLGLVVSGPPASGKSTLGRSLASRLGAALLDLDVVTGPLTGALSDLLGEAGDLEHPLLRAWIREPRYEAIIAPAVDNLGVGTPVVLVAPFTLERTDALRWAQLRERLAKAGGDPRLVWLRIEGDELTRRMAARGAVRDRAKLADVAAFLASEPEGPPKVLHIAIDAAWPLREQTEAVVAGCRG